MSVSTISEKHNYNYYLRSAYTKNRKAMNSDYRNTQSNSTIVSADADAVKTMAEKLRALEYDSDHGTEVLQYAKAFVESYNNLMDSTDSASDSTITNLKKQLSKMTKKEKEDLASIGIEIKSNGKLSIDTDTFGSSRAAKIGQVLSSEGTFSSSIRSIAQKIYRKSNQLPSYTAKANKTDSVVEESGKLVDLSL
jgi:translation initiation factor 2 beta subunit (eIF-2beta)/eIF-5